MSKKTAVARQLAARPEARQFQRLEHVGDSALGLLASTHLISRTTIEDDTHLLVVRTPSLRFILWLKPDLAGIQELSR